MIETKDLELVVQEHVQGKLLTNAMQIREFVQERVKDYSPDKYKGKVNEAKDDRATLNKAAKELNGKRIELEREFMKPFQDFKEVISDTVKTIKDASSQLDAVISEVEEQERQERREEIEAEYNATGFTLVPFEKLLESWWLNKTTSTKKWKEALHEKIAKISGDLESLEAVEYRDDARAFYLETLDIGRALQHAQTLKQRRDAIKASEQKAPAPDPAPTPEPEPAVAKPEEEPEYREPAADSVTLKLYGTRDQLVELRRYIDKLGITYEKL